MDTFRFLARRLLQGLAALLLIAVMNFLLVRAAPGDPATLLAGESGAADEVFLQQLRERFDLDRPLPQQLATYLGQLAQGDLGVSYRQQQPVIDLILDRLPATLLLTGTAFLLSLAIGVALGVWASVRAGTWKDSAISLFATVFYAMPVYWLALLAVLVFAVWLPWLPAFGYETVGGGHTGLARMLDIGRHLVLPAVVLAMFFMAVYARMTRASMLEVAGMDFVKTARAKGLPAGRVLRAHVLRNALLPVVTLAGLQAGAMVGGAVIIETVFAWPGIGRLLFDALQQRDYSLLLGTFLVTAALAVLFNIITDVAYTLVDPRIQLR
ncbi:ABC transporter permease [Ramlibacter tataouinensis]|uniref:ABC transporter permease n=1 Tax=Ramlibacter tataouinensis TaxID=94132 RepID=UPI0022F3D5A7|nr:ABC transporter permease [Ramlibacter tataouinensis]WBY01225.1 ABC transporter permease [Ramlibacter tataouinensis]